MRFLRIAALASDERGQSLVEVAVIVPLLLLILLGLIDIGRVFSFKVAVTNAARESAIHAARDGAVTLADVCQRARTELGGSTVVDPCNSAPIFVTCARVAAGTTPVGVDVASRVACDAGIDPSDTYSYLYRTPGEGGADVVISVRYDVPLLTGYLVGTVFRFNPVSVTASAAYPGLGQ